MEGASSSHLITWVLRSVLPRNTQLPWTCMCNMEEGMQASGMPRTLLRESLTPRGQAGAWSRTVVARGRGGATVRALPRGGGEGGVTRLFAQGPLRCPAPPIV